MDDIIAILYPEQDYDGSFAVTVLQMNENASFRVEQAEHEPNLSPLRGRDTRESTPSVRDIDCMLSDDDAPPSGQGLRLTFSHRPKAGNGFMLGTDAKRCDIVLPSKPLISRCHCYLTFDNERRLIVRDRSKHGTSVTYNGHGGQSRRNFTWIVGGHKVVNDEDTTIILDIGCTVRFKIYVPKLSWTKTRLENVDWFSRENTENALNMNALGIESTLTTADASGAQTPKQDSILLDQNKLGCGSFGTVFRVWDVSTGIEYASKVLKEPSSAWDDDDLADWRKEVNVMRNLSHVSVV